MQKPEAWTKFALVFSTFSGEKNTVVFSAEISLEVEFIGRSSCVHEQLSVAAFQVGESHSVSSRATLLCSAECPPLLSVCLLFNTGNPPLNVSKVGFLLNISSVCSAHGLCLLSPPYVNPHLIDK